MNNFTGKFLTNTNSKILNIKYKVIDNIWDYNKHFPCIIVRSLNPDYYLLFGSLNLIITEHGSILSHLSIVAKEHNITIFLSDDIISKIHKEGELSIIDNNLVTSE